jgi:hypothetical protein
MNTPITATHVFYSRSTNSVIDTCRDTNPPRSHIQNETLEEIRARYPDAEYIEFEKAIKISEDLHRLPVREITEKDFWEMLEVLPPAGWKQEPNCESFKLSERWSGNITDIYARIGERYFTLRDTIFLPHAEIIRRCKEIK